MNEHQKVSCFKCGKMSVLTIVQVQVHQRKKKSIKLSENDQLKENK